MYEKTLVNKKRSTIDRSIDSRGEKGIYTQPSLPQLPLFGKEQNMKYYNVDDTIYNVPRVGSLKKTDYHNRPWLIRKGNKSGLSMDSEQRRRLRKKEMNKYNPFKHVQSRYFVGKSNRISLAYKLMHANATEHTVESIGVSPDNTIGDTDSYSEIDETHQTFESLQENHKPVPVTS